MMPYERFEAWQLSHTLVLAVYRATSGWPPHERYGLVTQARRAAVSAASNIAEGAAKRGPREFRRYLDIAFGSVAELAYVLRLGLDLGYLTPAHWTELDGLRGQASRCIWGLCRSLDAPDRPSA